MDLLNILIVKTYNRIIQSETMYNGCNKLLSLHTYYLHDILLYGTLYGNKNNKYKYITKKKNHLTATGSYLQYYNFINGY